LRRIEIERDDGKITIINPLHITKLELITSRGLMHRGAQASLYQLSSVIRQKAEGLAAPEPLSWQE